MKTHPCRSCGACCAFFRVSFHWSETLKESFEVPMLLTQTMSAHRNSMNGTDQPRPRCVALKGTVGEDTSCAIYENRSSSCRDFKASFEDGNRDLQCEKARASKGLALLSLTSWD